MKQFFMFLALWIFTLLPAKEHQIPILEIKEYSESHETFMKKFKAALDEYGFFFLKGPLVDEKLVERAYNQATLFFKSDQKMCCRASTGTRGYVPGESPKGETRLDYKEFFHVGRELNPHQSARLRYKPNVWPSSPSSFRTTMLNLYKQLDKSKNTLGEAFSKLLGQDKFFIDEMIKEGDCLLRISHYPANPPDKATWAGAHKDINLFTLYPPSTGKGLEIQSKEGIWIPIEIPKNHILVHCGELLENLSNGLCKAAVHRVLNQKHDEERYSIMFFVHPRSDDRVDPLPYCVEKTGGTPLYPSASHLELLFERLIDLGIASDEVMATFVRLGARDKLKAYGRLSPDTEKALKEKGLVNLPEQPSEQ